MTKNRLTDFMVIFIGFGAIAWLIIGAVMSYNDSKTKEACFRKYLTTDYIVIDRVVYCKKTTNHWHKLK